MIMAETLGMVRRSAGARGTRGFGDAWELTVDPGV